MKATEINIVFEDGTVKRWTGFDIHYGGGVMPFDMVPTEHGTTTSVIIKPVITKPIRSVTEIEGSWSSLNNEVYCRSDKGSLYPVTMRDLIPAECNTAGEPKDYRFRFICEAVAVEEETP